ncbi:MAG: hypothetical protein CFR70_06865 [Rhodocyclaceae bacterium]|nr:DUF3025 domain-containing protein [Dechloromonas sp.]TEX48648.1 MAG: hypothetical protein CFR70_06865 [Rhodocyclaceae bacterium]
MNGASSLFWPVQRWLDELPDAPASDSLRTLTAQYPVALPDGRPVRFVSPQADGMPYECRLWERGEVETRPDNWHDFFNALIWLSFPETKRAITAAHVAAMQKPGEQRNLRRDALTHFDECGIVVLASDPTLLDLLRSFQWQSLFVERRQDVIAQMRFMIFGHATYEALLNPFRGLTAKAILLPVTPVFLRQDSGQLLAAVDAKIAPILAGDTFIRPRDFQPLPLLGIPGVTPDNEDPAYYTDTRQFRPGRRSDLMAA